MMEQNNQEKRIIVLYISNVSKNWNFEEPSKISQEDKLTLSSDRQSAFGINISRVADCIIHNKEYKNMLSLFEATKAMFAVYFI
jgi:hypothetical protein